MAMSHKYRVPKKPALVKGSINQNLGFAQVVQLKNKKIFPKRPFRRTQNKKITRKAKPGNLCSSGAFVLTQCQVVVLSAFARSCQEGWALAAKYLINRLSKPN